MSQCEADCGRAAYLASVTLASACFESKTYSVPYYPTFSQILDNFNLSKRQNIFTVSVN